MCGMTQPPLHDWGADGARVEAEVIRAEAMRYVRLQFRAAGAEAREIPAKAIAFDDSGVRVPIL